MITKIGEKKLLSEEITKRYVHYRETLSVRASLMKAADDFEMSPERLCGILGFDPEYWIGSHD